MDETGRGESSGRPEPWPCVLRSIRISPPTSPSPSVLVIFASAPPTPLWSPAPMRSGCALRRRLRRRRESARASCRPAIISIAARREVPAACGRDWRDTCSRKSGRTGMSISSRPRRMCSAPSSSKAATNAPSTPRSTVSRPQSPASAALIAAAAPRICDTGQRARRFLPSGKMLGRRPSRRLPLEGGAPRRAGLSPHGVSSPHPGLRRSPTLPL